MKKAITLFSLGLGLMIASPHLIVAKNISLQLIKQKSVDDSLGWDNRLWGNEEKPGDRWALIRAINYSLRYLNTPTAIQAYHNYPISGINRDRVRRSLIRFRQLLQQSRTPEELQKAVQREFILYQSVGIDNQGTVQFTGYFEPIYTASRQKTREYRYSLYRKPANFNTWRNPHPTRIELEGKDGLLGKRSPLKGYELVWLRDRLEAFLVQVQGSARLQLTNGKTMTVGFDGNTNYPYTSIGKELIKEGIFQPDELTLPVIIDYLQKNPQEMNKYLPRNNRFIFFKETKGAAAMGSLGIPVTPERSIATDKSVMPPGALALIKTEIPDINAVGNRKKRSVSRYVLDQDTGSAIKGAGRVDIFMGTGKIAGDKAGLITGTGGLYYLLLKN